MKTQDYIALEARHLAYNYHPLPVVLNRAEGSWMWDVEGNKYLDFLSTYSAMSMGHGNTRIQKALTDQLAKLGVPSRAFHTDQLGLFAQKLCQLTGLDKMCPMNTGAEAVETAIKAARRWGYRHKSIPDNKAEIIVSSGNFHGRTTSIVGFSSDSLYRQDFGPFDGGFVSIPYGDVEALEQAITPKTCAFLTEPMQGEAGIIIPPKGWLKQVYDVCKKNNVLLILDEVQTGLGRTGKNFAFEHEIDTPDGLILGKALGGGVYPVSAFLSQCEIMDVFEPGSHGSTFGGNPIACAVGLEALSILEQETLAERSAILGAHLKAQLEQIKSPYIKDIRGAGLWIGIEIDPDKASARALCEQLKDKGILCKETHETIIRLAPPLTITKEELDWALKHLHTILTL